MDQGENIGTIGPPSEGNTIGFWRDKSGKGHHGRVTKNSVTFSRTAIADSHPGLDFSGGIIQLDNTESFDSTNQVHSICSL